MKPARRNTPVYLPPSLDHCFQEADLPNATRPSVLNRAGATLKVYGDRWIRRYRLRQSLREMDTYRVEKDIGVPLGSLSDEARRPFWRE